jgi:uncharacterized protein (TIGR03435 family)
MTALFNHLWQSTMFAVAVALLTLAFRRERARLRYALWFAASAKFLLPFAAMAAVGSIVVWPQPPAPLRSVVATPIVRDVNAPFAAAWLESTRVAAAHTQPTGMISVVFAVWACGFVAILVRRVRQWRAIRAVIDASTPFHGVARVPDGIEVRRAPTTLEPGVVGIRRPLILLPDGLDSYLTADQFAAVVAHEVCHLRRRDNLTAAIHMVVEAVCWFHPLVWWIGARLVATREQACDEHVVADMERPLTYAEGIVGVCRHYVEAPLMTVAGVGGADVKARVDAILANRIGRRLTASKRLVLATVAALTLVVPVVAGAIEAAAFAAGQLPANQPPGSPIDPESRFDVISIKPSDPAATARLGMTPGHLDVVGAPLRMVMSLVFPIRRVVAWPGGIDADRYTITAKMPDGSPMAAQQVAIRNMLKDRFKLVTHTETREMSVYNLVLARSDGRLGPAFKESSPECQATVKQYVQALSQGATQAPTPAARQCMSSQPGFGNLAMNGVSAGALVNLLPQFVDRQVIDRTGLTAIYDLTLKWTPDPIPSALGLAPPPLPAADPDAPNIFTAVQEQLGLKLESGRGPVEVIVIDHLEKPMFD